MIAVPVAATLSHLRRSLRQVEAGPAAKTAEPSLRLGVAAIDQALGGGIALGALHEVAPAMPLCAGAAAGFALALAALARMRSRHVLWIQGAFVRTEAGTPYGPGLGCFGLSMDRLILLDVARATDSLWAMEEALKCSAALVIAEFYDDEPALDLTAMRRLSLAARTGGGLGLILRHRTSSAPSAAVTRWEVASTCGVRDGYGGLGRTAFVLSLTKNRHGPCGQWVLSWDHHECAFSSALSRGVAETAGVRSDRAPLRRVG
jgi:protein ImuA